MKADMESSQGNSCSVIQYYKSPKNEANSTDLKFSNSFEARNSVEEDLKLILNKNSEDTLTEPLPNDTTDQEDHVGESKHDNSILAKTEIKVEKLENETNSSFSLKDDHTDEVKTEVKEPSTDNSHMGIKIEDDVNEAKSGVVSQVVKKEEVVDDVKLEPELETKEENLENVESESQSKKGRKRKFSETNADCESVSASNVSAEDAEEGLESDFDDIDEDDEETDNKPRRRGRCKKNPDIIPSHLSSDIVLGYKILLKFLETPQFSGFHKPFKRNTETEDCKITCLNQIKKKFEENSYKKVNEFVNDVREMLVNIYESRNPVSIKKALRLEQILEQRIAQLPNYLRPSCALVLSPEEVNNSHNKIRISKGGGFVSLLLEKTEKKRYEKNREKRKLLAEERKQLKEEQDKDVQEWEKNVLLKDFEEDIKSMWELPAIGHFIHLCADILNIGEVAQFEVERMLLMPQCSDTLDLIMTALLTNSLVRAKLDRTPSMPYSIWGPLVRTRVLSWYRTWHREGRNEQKLFEEIGIEPDFWQILGPDINPLDYYYFHELTLFQRVWILKTLCDVDFVRKKTVHDNIRAQTLDELNPVHLGLDQQGNRYIQFKQFCGSDIRIYRQSTKLDDDISPSELIESVEGFEYREGPITADKVFRDIWELNEKPEVKTKKRKVKTKRARTYTKISTKVVPYPAEKKNLRRSVRAKQKTYTDWSDSDQSDTDLITLKKKLTKPDTETLYRPFSDKEFISLSVFRLPRDKITKPTSKRSSYYSRKAEESCRNEGSSGEKGVKTEAEERKEDGKPVGEDEQSDSLDSKQMQDIQADFKKIFKGDDMNGDEFDLEETISNCKLDKVNSDVNFTVKNLENLKMIFSKGEQDEETSEETTTEKIENPKTEDNNSTRDKEYDALYKYNVPDHFKPDSSKFYLVVDSVEGLRQLISKFGSHENDLEIITRSTKSKKRNSESNTSCEVQLIERLQNLLEELEPWEFDFMKSHRSNKEKMYKEYMSFINRPPDFVHPNESYWMKTYEEPAATTTSVTTTTTTTTTTTAVGASTNGEKTVKEGSNTVNESVTVQSFDNSTEVLMPRKRTRVTRLQLQPQNDDLDEDFDDVDDYESNESDDNWVLPTSKRKAKKETAAKSPKVSRRSASKRAKLSLVEKTDSQTSSVDKPQNSTPEKAKKALFWGPRSSDPSEDLNWEKNRQKILEQHNSPVKKVIFKSDDIINDAAELETVLKQNYKADNPSTSVITSPPKRVPPPPIPGNKKPYFSSAQLKAMESQAKKEGETSQQKSLARTSPLPASNIVKPEMKTTACNTSPEMNTVSKTPVKMHTYSRIRKAGPSSSVKSCQTPNIQTQSPSKKGTVESKIDVANPTSHQLVKFAQQINKQVQNSVTSGSATSTKAPDASLELNSTTQAHIQQPASRIQQIQIQQSPVQTPLNKGTSVRVQQPTQWQPKVIAVQSISQPTKTVQQQVQTQAQVQMQRQPQVHISNQPQVQGQIQQVIRLEPQKVTALQQPIQGSPEKPGTVQQMVISSPQPSSSLQNPDNDLYITDGKLLIKFDNNFVQQYLQKDKVVTINVNDKTLDLKSPLLIVKPKMDTGPNVKVNQAPTEPSTSQQNILVLNKPGTVQQTVVSSPVPNYVIPGNYVIKEGTQTQPQSEQQVVKIVQQAPTYVIQQKAVGGKGPPSQIIKLITTQPVGNNQNIILTPANINLANQVLPVSQPGVPSDQQTKPASTTMRFVRPANASSTPLSIVQNKSDTVQNQIFVNNLVQISDQRVDGSKTTNQVVAGRIVSTSVPTVRMTTPAQTQTVVSSPHANLQSVSIPTNIIAQPVKTGQGTIVSSSPNSGAQIVRGNQNQPLRSTLQQQLPTMVISGNGNQQIITSLTDINQQTIRVATGAQTQVQGIVSTNAPTVISSQPMKMATSAQTQTLIPSNPQLLKSPGMLNTQSVRLSSQPHIMQTQTVVVSANSSPQGGVSTMTLNAQPVRIATVAQSQGMVSPANGNPQNIRAVAGVNPQQVRLVAGGQPQQVRFVANNSVGVRFINRNVSPVKGAVVTSTSQPQMVAVRPSGVVGQPVRFQAIIQPAGVRPAVNRLQLSPGAKKVDLNTLVNTPVIIKIQEEEDTRTVEERNSEVPVSVDYIHGELSVKKTSQGWKYAVKASNGKDIILTDEQIEERLKANNGVLK